MAIGVAEDEIETGLYATDARYYDPNKDRFINADTVLGKKGEILGHNIYAYCGNSPISYCDSSGKEKSTIHISSSGSVYGGITGRYFANDPQFEYITKSSTTLFYSEGMPRVQIDHKVFPIYTGLVPKNEITTDYLGIFTKQSIVNGSTTMGLTNGPVGVYLKGVNDLGTTSAQFGINTKGGLGATAKLKASAYTGRSTLVFEVFGWTIEIGASVDIGAIGGEASIGLINGNYHCEASGALGIGLGLVFRAKPN